MLGVKGVTITNYELGIRNQELGAGNGATPAVVPTRPGPEPPETKGYRLPSISALRRSNGGIIGEITRPFRD